MKYKDQILMDDSTESIPWIEKYRPTNLDQIISHREIISSLRAMIAASSMPHLLFVGPPGTGKTSIIKCCALEIYGPYLEHMVLELNASIDRRIDVVRVKIRGFANAEKRHFLPPNMSTLFKLVILDESDSMTIDAQVILRQIMERSCGHTRFCLICNDIGKIGEALQSRCSVYRFSPLKPKEVKNKIKEICDLENISYDEEALQALVRVSKGDLRSAINNLQHSKMVNNFSITAEDIYKISGHMFHKTTDQIYTIIKNAKTRGLEKTCEKITEIVIDNNITIFNLLNYLQDLVLMDKKFNLECKIYLITMMANFEVYDTVNVSQNIILASLVSLFYLKL